MMTLVIVEMYTVLLIDAFPVSVLFIDEYGLGIFSLSFLVAD